MAGGAKAKRAGKGSKKNSGTSTPTESSNPVPELKKLTLNYDRSATGVLASQQSSRDIKIESFTLSFHGRLLISNATIELNFGRRYGLIGTNGSGKSTFLECIAAREVPIPEHTDIYLLNEEAPATEMSAVEYVIDSAEKEIARLEAQIEDILAEDGGADDPLLDDIYERIEELDPSTFESRAAVLLNGLGFDGKSMQKKTKDMSGGWRMRVSLAKALFCKPTVLLLDEPTNHLDLEACVWLEEYLKTYNRILVVVSHSQDFLNGVCTNIMNLTPLKTLVYYGGNYDSFVKTKAENDVNQMKAYNKQQAEIEHIKKFVASAGTYANLVKQAKSKLKIIEKMEAEGLVQKVETAREYKFAFNETEKLPPPVLSFDDVTFAYSGKIEDALYKNLDLAVDMDSRVAIVGPNGVGKSTLLKLMDGTLSPNSGRVSRHSHLKLAKYSQHSNDQLDVDMNPIDYMRKRFPEEPSDIDSWRQKLGRFGLTGTHQTSLIGTLSDGLKSRLVFAEIALSRPHIILLDEPTNHLDMESIDSLANAINEFDGGMVLVSHDFRLISQVAQTIWLVDNARIEEWTEGGIEAYKESLRKKVKLV